MTFASLDLGATLSGLTPSDASTKIAVRIFQQVRRLPGSGQDGDRSGVVITHLVAALILAS